MYHQERILDSYQNEVARPPMNESVETVGTGGDDINIQHDADPYAEAAVTYASDGMWDTDEDAERVVEPSWAQRKRDAQGRWAKV